ncbi:response regulator (plasmid) [Pedobacter sp. BS3]|uniref:response regulator n=1 Tax=Pedobacter sp. BS3 TaxID=2567937 RepID=UPI0011F07F1B|nr:response regulator [Pedobacter sp. BS3]TZF85824.1 response regulator [Pedobacter sp. BS3]
MSRVFIIDDDPIHQRIAQIMIDKYQLFDSYASYTDASQALEFLEKNAHLAHNLPDVILLDLNMPVIDGWAFLDQYEMIAEKMKKAVKIYIVTSSVDEKDKLRSQKYTYVSGFISKPLSPDIIRSTL